MMHESRYVVFSTTRKWGDRLPHEVYWNGKVGQNVPRPTTRRVASAAVFDTAREAYDAVGALVKVGHLPREFLDARVGKRMVTDG